MTVIDQMCTLIMQKRLVTVRKLVDEFKISIYSVHLVVSGGLAMQNVPVKLKLLTMGQNQVRLDLFLNQIYNCTFLCNHCIQAYKYTFFCN